MDAVAKVLKDNRDVNLMVVGHTHNAQSHAHANDADWHQNLSFLRALEVVKQLSMRGVSGRRLRAHGEGYAQMLVPPGSKDWKRNQRIEFLYDGPVAAPAPAPVSYSQSPPVAVLPVQTSRSYSVADSRPEPVPQVTRQVQVWPYLNKIFFLMLR